MRSGTRCNAKAAISRLISSLALGLAESVLVGRRPNLLRLGNPHI